MSTARKLLIAGLLTIMATLAPAQKRPAGGSIPASGIAIPELRLQSVEVSPANGAGVKQASTTQRLARVRIVPIEPDGRVATNVKFESFSVAANGKPIPVRRVAAAIDSDSHLNVALLLDVSGSMHGTRIEAARKAISLFLDKLHPADRVALITFGKSASLRQDFTTDKAKVLQAIQRAQAIEDHTAVYDALELTTRISWGGMPGDRAVVLLSDGIDNSSHLKADDVAHLVEKRNIPIYTIALGQGAHRATFLRFATLSGGSAFATDSVGNTASLSDLYLETWKHLAGGYIVEFNPPDGVRHVQITWKRRDNRNPTVDADLMRSQPIPAPSAPQLAANRSSAKPRNRFRLPLPWALGGAALVIAGMIGAGIWMRRNAQQRISPVGNLNDQVGSLHDWMRQNAQQRTLQVGSPDEAAGSMPEQPTVTPWTTFAQSDTLASIDTKLPTNSGYAADSGQPTYKKGETLVRPVPGDLTGVVSAWLVVVSGPSKGRQFTLTSEEAVIGRSAESQIQLDADADVSRSHAKIKATVDGYIVVDLASTNGVLVNGVRVYQTKLQDNDRITIGQSEFVFKALGVGVSSPVA